MKIDVTLVTENAEKDFTDADYMRELHDLFFGPTPIYDKQGNQVSCIEHEGKPITLRKFHELYLGGVLSPTWWNQRLKFEKTTFSVEARSALREAVENMPEAPMTIGVMAETLIDKNAKVEAIGEVTKDSPATRVLLISQFVDSAQIHTNGTTHAETAHSGVVTPVTFSEERPKPKRVYKELHRPVVAPEHWEWMQEQRVNINDIVAWYRANADTIE